MSYFSTYMGAGDDSGDQRKLSALIQALRSRQPTEQGGMVDGIYVPPSPISSVMDGVGNGLALGNAFRGMQGQGGDTGAVNQAAESMANGAESTTSGLFAKPQNNLWDYLTSWFG